MTVLITVAVLCHERGQEEKDDDDDDYDEEILKHTHVHICISITLIPNIITIPIAYLL